MIYDNSHTTYNLYQLVRKIGRVPKGGSRCINVDITYNMHNKITHFIFAILTSNKIVNVIGIQKYMHATLITTISTAYFTYLFYQYFGYTLS